MKPMDRLCMVLADHLETNMQRPNQAVESAGQLPINQEVEPPPGPAQQCIYLSQLMSLEQVLLVAGITSPEVRENYVKLLVDEGFETPFLMLGLCGNAKLLKEIGFKTGHAIRLLQMLENVVNDTGLS